MADKKKNGLILNFKTSEHLKNEITRHATAAGLKPGTFIKAVVKKYIKYKEPDLV